MLVLALQVAMSLVKVLAGTAILSVGMRDLHGSPVHRLSWQLTGCTFVIGGASAVVQLGIFAPWAFFAGEGTAVWDAFLRWNPALTQSRTSLMIGLGLLLMTLPGVGRRRPPSVATSVGFLVFMMLIGGVAGWAQGGFAAASFFSSTAVTNLLELVVLLTALFVALLRDTMDRYLWLAVLVYAVSISLNVISYAALAWVRVDGVWVPRPVFVQVFLVLAHATMVGLAVRRLRLARRGVHVGGLLEPLVQRPLSVLR